jgi:tetratricopeptide (TPR) repeat protein
VSQTSWQRLLEEGFTQQKAGNLRQAEMAYRSVLQHRPQEAQALSLLGTLYLNTQRSQEALPLLEQAKILLPQEPAVFFNLASALAQNGQLEKATDAARASLKLQPESPDVWLLLGNLQRAQGDFNSAETSYRHSLSLAPERLDAAMNLAVVLKDQNQMDEAESLLRAILARQPQHAGVLGNLSQVCKELGKYEDALKYSVEALNLMPENAEAHVNLGMLFLLMRQYAQAWPELAWRFRTSGYRGFRHHDFPVWDGQQLNGRTLLVFGEGGIGDEINYASCLSDLQKFGGHIVLAVHPKLVTLYQRSFPDAAVISRRLDGSPPVIPSNVKVDVQVPLFNLPSYLRQKPADFPLTHSFLKADPKLITVWRERVASLGTGQKIGLAWTSRAHDLANSMRKRHSLDLMDCEALLRRDRCHFINLQYGDVAKELEDVRQKIGVAITAFPDLDLFDDLESVAALLVNLDCVVAINSAVAHLAAALGVKTRALVPYSFAYPAGVSYVSEWLASLRYVPQPRLNDWQGALSAVFEKDILL